MMLVMRPDLNLNDANPILERHGFKPLTSGIVLITEDTDTKELCTAVLFCNNKETVRVYIAAHDQKITSFLRNRALSIASLLGFQKASVYIPSGTLYFPKLYTLQQQKTHIKATPINLKEANAFIREYHRHNKPVVGGKFYVGASINGNLIGVAVVSRPVARLLDDGQTAEVVRTCTTGERNVNSFLYSRCIKISKLMGYQKLITYTLQEESGASLKAVGAVTKEIIPASNGWNRSKRQREWQEIYAKPKIRWRLY